MFAIQGKKTRMKVGFFRCPHCKAAHEFLVSELGGKPFRCDNCNKIIAKNDDEVETRVTTVEREVDGFVCALCGEDVSDTPSNWCGETTEAQRAVFCPKCQNIVNGFPLIHHGAMEDFRPFYTGTDYFAFQHEPCKDKEHHGFSAIYAVLIDNRGRIIFDLRCEDCGKVDALKTHTHFWAWKEAPRGHHHTIESIYLSPKLRQRIGKHGWDNL